MCRSRPWGPAVVGNTYLEGTYSEIYPNISQDEEGLRKLFVQFSFPVGFPATLHPRPRLDPRGGELGYSLSHSFGAVFDNPDLSSRAWSAMAKRKPAAGDGVAFQ